MKKSSIVVAAILAFAANGSFALTAQQEKMQTCNADAKTKAIKGEERKSFMKECLSGKPVEPAGATLTPQQEKMKACNADAKGKKGVDRKKFMSECLSGGVASSPAVPAAQQVPTKVAPTVAVPAAPPKAAAPAIVAPAAPVVPAP